MSLEMFGKTIRNWSLMVLGLPHSQSHSYDEMLQFNQNPPLSFIAPFHPHKSQSFTAIMDG